MRKFLNLKETNSKKSTGAIVKTSLCMDSVCNILQHFKISSRLQYFPEYKKEIKIDTIIVAYAINDHLIYSNKDLKIVKNNDQRQLQITNNDTPIILERITSFHLFLPHIERKEIDFKKSAYLPDGPIEAEERNANDFIRGNSITLFIRDKAVKGIPHLDTTVEKRVVFKDDIYANRPLVMLTPLLDSFECIDFRRFNRLNTNIPCFFSLGKKLGDRQCVIQDFSERFIRVEFSSDNEKTIRRLEEGSRVFLKVPMENDDDDLVFRGNIYKTRKCYVVIVLQNLMKNGKFQSIDHLDEVYIKSTMIGHSATDRNSST